MEKEEEKKDMEEKEEKEEVVAAEEGKVEKEAEPVQPADTQVDLLGGSDFP